jgi:hypothetical protein
MNQGSINGSVDPEHLIRRLNPAADRAAACHNACRSYTLSACVDVANADLVSAAMHACAFCAPIPRLIAPRAAPLPSTDK